MAERAPKLVLHWERREIDGVVSWHAKAGPIWLVVTEPLDVEGFYWRVAHWGHGLQATLVKAQELAEERALQLLREGVEALGGRALTGEQVALVVEALRLSAGMHERMSRVIGDEREVRGKAALSLAKELEG